jgi:hypothetical protein
MIEWLDPMLTPEASAVECLGISLCSLVCLHGGIEVTTYKVLRLQPF